MGARPTSRTRSRNAKFRRRRRSLGKLSCKLRQPMIANEETTDAEGTRSLLLSSLRYWEVERDLIDERLAAIRERSRINTIHRSKPRLKCSTNSNQLC